MFKDMELSRDIMGGFDQVNINRSDRCVDSSLILAYAKPRITGKCWNVCICFNHGILADISHCQCDFTNRGRINLIGIVPTAHLNFQLCRLQEIFTRFYLSKHTGRKLQWQYTLDHCLLKGWLKEKVGNLYLQLHSFVSLVCERISSFTLPSISSASIQSTSRTWLQRYSRTN